MFDTIDRMAIDRYSLKLAAFAGGFVLMSFEMAAARVLAPTIGSSTYVWTSVIGIIMAAMSAGYYYGGKLADTNPSKTIVAFLILGSSFAIAITLQLYQPVLLWLSSTRLDLRMQGVVASIVLFAPTSFLLGALSPYLAKLNIESISKAGQAIATLSALNAIGSIIGTFATGFFLFSVIGSRSIFLVLAIILIALSWLFAPRHKTKIRLIFSAIILFIALTAQDIAKGIQIDTTSSHYTIEEIVRDGQPMRVLATGPGGYQSGIFLNNKTQHAFSYTQEIATVVQNTPQHERILVIGGGGMTLPRLLASKYNTTIDVVEIDASLADISRRYFDYDDPANVNIIVDDGRSYINKTNQKYDIVIIDVFGNTEIPPSFLTAEYGERLARIIKPHGLVAVNTIAGVQGPCKQLLDMIARPYHDSFSHVSFYQLSKNSSLQNIIVLASQQQTSYDAYIPLPQNSDFPRYTDDFIPSEKIYNTCLETARRERT